MRRFNNSSVELKQNHTKIKKLMASFSGKVYGKRSAERRRKKKEVKNCENNTIENNNE